ncbi:hypothetical protein Jiend_22710 [Micromonospora endophytica]|nr:hypothetical protein Jiend_22710 [Micromonospora endophytica]
MIHKPEPAGVQHQLTVDGPQVRACSTDAVYAAVPVAIVQPISEVSACRGTNPSSRPTNTAMKAVTDDITGYAIAAGRGDRAAAAAFVRATQHDVRRFLAHLPGVREVDDLVQETYLRAWRALPSFAGRSTARTWLLAIARRVAVDQVRAATCRPRTANLTDWEAAAESTPAGVCAGVDERVVLHGLLDGLSPERREAFVSTQLLGLSYAEAAQVCDVPVGTIRSRVARAREDLIAAMRPATGHRRRPGAAG